MASSDGPDGQGEVETCSPPTEPLPCLRLSSRSLSRLNSYLDVLLILVPIGLVSGALGWPAKAVFPLNFLAVIPLTPKITFAIRQLSARLGEVGAELCRVITSHPVGIIVGITTVCRGKIDIAREILVGSIMFYSLLVLGSSIFVAGYDKESLEFTDKLTSIMECFMVLVSISLLVPTVALPPFEQSDPTKAYYNEESDILLLSHGTSVILFVTFVAYLYFYARIFAQTRNERRASSSAIGNGTAAGSEARFPLWASAFLLITAIAATAACAFYLVDSVDGFSKSANINKTFISMILIPFACNATQYINISAVSREDKIGLAVKEVIASSLQITLLVIPCLVLLGWLLRQPMALNFDTFEAAVFILAILVVDSITKNQKATYFEGIMLTGTYVVIAVAFLAYREPDDPQ